MQKKNKMIEDAKEAVRIKEEEEITKRNVKTIMDVEAAQLEREKLQENRYCQIWTQIHILELQAWTGVKLSLVLPQAKKDILISIVGREKESASIFVWQCSLSSSSIFCKLIA